MLRNAMRDLIQNYGMTSIKRITPAADGEDHQLEVYDQNVQVDSTSGDCDVFLPPVGAAVGKMYIIQITAFGTGNTVTVKPYSAAGAADTGIHTLSGANPAASVALAEDEGWIIVVSNGRAWFSLGHDLAPSS